MVMVYAQAIKNESKQESIHPYVSIARGMKSLLVQHMIMSSLEQPSSLHVLLSSMFVAPDLSKSSQE
jgi:hypothetical protein